MLKSADYAEFACPIYRVVTPLPDCWVKNFKTNFFYLILHDTFIRVQCQDTKFIIICNGCEEVDGQIESAVNQCEECDEC